MIWIVYSVIVLLIVAGAYYIINKAPWQEEFSKSEDKNYGPGPEKLIDSE